MDDLDKAIAAEAAPQAVPMVQAQVTISSTGRPFQIAVPADLTDSEMVEIVGWMTTSLRKQIEANRQQKPRILVPTGVRLA